MKTALIAGGGIGGLASAIALRQAGWRVRVYERAVEMKPVGAALAIWANGLRALDRLGVGAAMRVAGGPVTDSWIRTAEGKPLLAVSDASLRARFGEIGVMLHRADVHDILLSAAGDVVTTGARLIDFHDDGRRVVARFDTGEEVTGDMLIGADGIHSVVRAALHGTQPLRYAGYTAWRAVIAFAHHRLTPGESWGRGLRFGHAPLRGGHVYAFATADVPEGARAPHGERAELLRLFSHFHDPIPSLIESMREDDILRNDIHDLPPLRRWGRGRVTLLGDAAHPMTPNLGQGACQALEDAAVLGRHLAAGGSVPAALRAYEAQRRPRTASFVRRSRSAGAIGQWQHPFAVGVRNLLARHALPRLQPRQLADLVDVPL